MTTVYEIAPAKVNLDLHVCRRRDDGYHDLDSLVVFTDIGDKLAFTPARKLTLAIEGPFAWALTSDQDNLVLKAVRSLAASLGRSPDVHITLDKRLPVSSGLGGGSADAAAALRGLLRFWDLPMTIGDLSLLARGLGADVPACLDARPVRMMGIGDRLAPFDLPKSLSILLVNPGTPVETPTVFRMLQRMSGERPLTNLSEDAASFRAMCRQGVNDLEAPAMRLAPVIGEVLEAIRRQPGCDLARMSGSGATCFGLFHDQRSLDRAKKQLRVDHPGWWIVPTICQ